MDYGALGAKEAEEWKVKMLAFNLVVGYARIDLRDRNLKKASRDQEFLISMVDELKRVFNISHGDAERALVMAFEKEVEERKKE